MAAAKAAETLKRVPKPFDNAAVEVRPLECAEDGHGWTVLATTVGPEVCADTEILQAYHTQNTTVEPGFRWIKSPAALSPGWLEKPERIAA